MFGWLGDRFRRGKEATRPAPKLAITLAPAVVLVCGAGVAFWWWTQWAGAEDADEKPVEPSLDGLAKEGVVSPAAAQVLDEDLGVQAAPEPTKP